MEKVFMRSDYLLHFGVKGQKWGVRNGPPYPLERKKNERSEAKEKAFQRRTKLGRLFVQGFLFVSTMGLLTVSSFNGDLDIAREKAKIRGPKLSTKEYAHVMSEIATHISAEQRNKSIFSKNIGQYRYTIINNKDGTYDLLYREKINK